MTLLPSMEIGGRNASLHLPLLLRLCFVCIESEQQTDKIRRTMEGRQPMRFVNFYTTSHNQSHSGYTLNKSRAQIRIPKMYFKRNYARFFETFVLQVKRPFFVRLDASFVCLLTALLSFIAHHGPRCVRSACPHAPEE
jgi:hypothetical protein